MTPKAKKLFGLGPALVLACFVLTAAPALALPPSFGTEGEGAGQIAEEAQGVAVDQESGDIYVADRKNSRIDKFGPNGEFLLAWGWGVADGHTEALQTCTTECFKGLEGAGAGEFAPVFGAEGIAVNNDPFSPSHGDVYVVDSLNLRVQEFDPEGHFLTMFGGEVNAKTNGDVCPANEAASCKEGVEGTGPGQFTGLNGRSIAVDSEGTVYVGDENRVQRFSEAGAVLGKIAFTGVGRIENLAIDSAKDIYLRASELAGVHKYGPSGEELGAPRDEAGYGPKMAIAIGPANELFVNDLQEDHHILTFNAEGEQLASFDRGGLLQDGGNGIAYSDFTKALYVLNEGAVRIVTPPLPGPFVVLGSEMAGEVEPASAKLEALVNPEERANVNGELKYHFDYGTSSSYGNSTTPVGSAGGSFEDRPVTAALTALTPSTVYHFRVVIENAANEVTDGPDQTFTTLPPVSIDATSVSQVNATSARLEAELNPHGVASEYRFEYGTTTEYGQSIPISKGSVGSGKVDTTVENIVQELLPSTTYHYRVVAENKLGKVEGEDKTFITQGAASVLPDGRQWEMVSPPNKHGSPLEPITEEGGLLQAAADGGGFAYVALGPINEEPKGVRSPNDTQLLATRGPSGWSTQDITTPHEEISILHPGFPSEYKFFAEDLSSSVVEPEGVTRLDPENPANTERTPYRREADGAFAPLVTSENVPSGTKFGGNEQRNQNGEPSGDGEWGNGVEFRAATPDLSQVVLNSPQALTAGFKPGFEPSEVRKNLYELSGGSLTLVSVLPNGEPTTEAGLAAGVGRNNVNLRGALSSDGNRVVFETNAGEHLYLRDVPRKETLQLDEPEPGAVGGTGEPRFQAASSDGGKVFFADAARLTGDSTARAGQPDLYMCEVKLQAEHLACALSDLSVDHTPGEAGDVQGEVSAIDAEGGHVYFAANGILTSGANTRGEVAARGNCNSEEEASCNLYEYDTATRQLSLVAELSSKDDPDWAGRTAQSVLGNLTARSSPDGRYFTFMSQQSLTGYDNRDEHSGARDEEVFQLNAEDGALSCISCNPTGARPNGVFDKPTFPGLLVDHASSWGNKNTDPRWLAGSIPGWDLISGGNESRALYQSRYLSDSGREFFNSSDALVPQDTNSVNDVYEFEPSGVGDCTSSSATYSQSSGGCVNLISSGTSKEESAFLDATEDGNEVFFLTSARLLGSDVDSAFDVYDAHVCTSSSPCPPPPPPPAPACQGDACQNPVAAPSDATPGSLTFHGPGNQTTPPKVVVKSLTRAQKLAAALKTCKKTKGNGKQAKAKRAKCEKTARKNYGPVKQKAKKKGKKG